MAGIRIHQRAVPSQKVDGDFIDFFRQGDGLLDVVVGDVMGKGVPAALVGAAMKTRLLQALTDLFRSSRRTEIPAPEHIIGDVQRHMVHQLQDLETFVTLCYARFDRN